MKGQAWEARIGVVCRGTTLSSCTFETAIDRVSRGRAVWLNENTIELTSDSKRCETARRAGRLFAAEVIARDGGGCAFCPSEAKGAVLVAKDALFNDPANFVPACDTCSSEILRVLFPDRCSGTERSEAAKPVSFRKSRNPAGHRSETPGPTSEPTPCRGMSGSRNTPQSVSCKGFWNSRNLRPFSCKSPRWCCGI